jgi:hypothetical protein
MPGTTSLQDNPCLAPLVALLVSRARVLRGFWINFMPERVAYRFKMRR